MRERNRIMEDRADAFHYAAGRHRTLEELFEAWTGGYLGMHDKPGGEAGSGRTLRRAARMVARAALDSGYVSQAAMDRWWLSTTSMRRSRRAHPTLSAFGWHR